MSESKLNNVAMIGAGTLGGQIAWHSAYYGQTRHGLRHLRERPGKMPGRAGYLRRYLST